MKLWLLASLPIIWALASCKTTTVSATIKDQSSSEPRAVWTSEGGNVLLNGQVMHIKGANWFGLETPGANLLGLGKRSLTSILDWLISEDFNALRIPLSVQWSLDFNAIPPDQGFTAGDQELKDKAWIEVLDKLVLEAGKRGMVIMLDMHTVSAGDNLTTKRWYSERYGICEFRKAWHNLLDRYGHRWNIFALDLKNELHDVDWGNADLTGQAPTVCDKDNHLVTTSNAKPTDWKQEVESLVPELAIQRYDAAGQAFYYNGLYLVQGMHYGKIGEQAFPYDIERPFGFWFGGNLEGLRHYPLKIPFQLANRIAYTIHVYGPSVHPQKYFDDLDAYRNPNALDTVYESQHGFVEPTTGRALIIGEWGGINEVLQVGNPEKDGKDDAVILEKMADWFPKNCIADAFWWAINPESSDTGGLFSDLTYSSPIRSKLERARSMMPHPSKLVVTSEGEIKFANAGAFHPLCAQKQQPQPMRRPLR